MAIYKVVVIGDPVLRENACSVPEINSNILKLLDNMADTMYSAKGVGLAAPQIGVSKRVITVDVGEGLWELINPEIIERHGEDIDIEGCLSVPGVIGKVKRASRVVVKGLNREGKEITIKTSGLGARCFQHEIDHLNGVLFIDKAMEIKSYERG